MNEYSCGDGCTYYRAPIYLVLTVIGMIAMVFCEKIAIQLGLEKKKLSPVYSELNDKPSGDDQLLSGNAINDEVPSPLPKSKVAGTIRCSPLRLDALISHCRPLRLASK